MFQAVPHKRCIRIARTRQVVSAVLQPPKESVLSLAQARRCLQDCINDRLQLIGRARDDAQHVADRCLIFERFLHLEGTRLHLVEQPRVLDCDYRLIGKCLEKLNLRVRERAHL